MMRQGLLVLGRKRIQQFLSLIVVICLSCSILLNLLNPWWEHDDDFIMSHSEPLMEQQNRNAVIMSNTHVRQQQRRTMAPQNSSHNTIGYIHIGKTGGSTISNLLRNGCHSFSGSKPCRKNIANETIISKLVEHYYHVPDFWRLPTSNHRAYIISIRDPFQRTVSALLYDHPSNTKFYKIRETKMQKKNRPLAYECFPTLEIFSSLLTRGNSTSCYYPYEIQYIETGNCTELACAAIHGKVRFFNHLFFNYRNILYTKIPIAQPPIKQQRQIYVIRQEYLWNDWVVINKMFNEEESSSSDIVIPTDFTNELNVLRNISGLELPVTRDISNEGRKKLCKSLETEYIAYFDLLEKAENINGNDVEKSVQIASSNCPNLDIHFMLK